VKGSGEATPAPEGYEILGELGRGAMGVVYKARQRGLNRLVALKMVLSASRASADELARFHVEAEAVARLDHPNIVKIYDVGQRDGLPFFALEYVEGGTLADHVGSTPQPAREAAAVVQALAEAMDYAHRRGIVHRDLKPANVLLQKEEGGRMKDEKKASGSSFLLPPSSFLPKISDFGLAKRLEGDSGQTRDGSILGTPSFMAPEQAEGRTRDVGPASDTYALGAILYHLLTGGPPFRGQTVHDTLRQVIQNEPLPPVRLQGRVPRDLNTICLKCLEKDPRKRYATTGDLAEDLRRFLADEPIKARPAPWWERTAKWARRRPAAAALIVVSALAVAALSGGGFLYAHHERLRAEEACDLRMEAEEKRNEADKLRQIAEGEREEAREQRHRAEENFRQACAAVDQMLARLGQQRLAHEPRMEKLRQELLEQAVRFYERFLNEHSHDPGVRWQTARTLQNLGNIERMLGRHREAEARYRKALPILDDLVESCPDEPLYRRDLAATHHNLGVLLGETHHAEAAALEYEKARDLRRQLAEENPGDPKALANLAATEHNLGLVLQNRGRSPEAEAAFRAALQLQEQLVTGGQTAAAWRIVAGWASPFGILPPRSTLFGAAATPRQELARTCTSLGHLLQATGRTPEAKESFETARRLLGELTAGSPEVPEYRQELALVHNQLGRLLRDVEPAAAEKSYGQAIRLQETLVADFPATPGYRQELAATLNNLGVLLQATGRREGAEEAFSRALTLKDSLAGSVPWVPDFRRDLAGSLNNRAIHLQTQNRLREAEPAYERAVETLRKLTREFPDTPEYHQELARTLANEGTLFQSSRRPAQAEKLYRQALEIRAAMVARHPEVPEYRQELARTHLNLATLLQLNGKLEDAEKSYREGVEILSRLATDHPGVPDYRHLLALGCTNLGNLLRDRQRSGEAEPLWQQARALLTALTTEFPKVPGYRQDLGRALNEWAAFLAAARKDNEAEQAWEQARHLQKALVTKHPREPAYRQDLARTLSNLGILAARANRIERAEDHFRQAIAVLEEMAPSRAKGMPYRQDLLVPATNLASLLTAAGRTREAEPVQRKVVELRRQLVGERPKDAGLQADLAAALHALANLFRENDRADEMRACLDEAVRHQRAALEAKPSQESFRQAFLHYSEELADLLIRLEDHVAADRTLTDLLQFTPSDWPHRPQAAAQFVRCAQLAAADPKLSEAERGRLAEERTDRALMLLRQAVDQGFKDADYLKRAEEFIDLRDREAFQELVKRLEGK
jgi:serine/threonine-protein kinase